MAEAVRPGRNIFPLLISIFLFGGHHQSLAATAGWPETHLIPSQQGHSSSVGNHRFTIHVDKIDPNSNQTVSVTIPWRRHDNLYNETVVLLVDARSHLVVRDCSQIKTSRDSTTIVFRAAAGPSEYHLYYMPFTTCEYDGGTCSFGANVEYIKKDSHLPPGLYCTSDNRWWNPLPLDRMTTPSSVEYQARTMFSEFTDMEFTLTQDEQDTVIQEAQKANLCTPSLCIVPEDRMNPVKMSKFLPLAWKNISNTFIKDGAFMGTAQPGEHYTFQLVAIGLRKQVAEVTSVTFKALTESSMASLSMHCMNFNGTDYWGRSYQADTGVLVSAGDVVSLWVSVNVPLKTTTGTYEGAAIVHLSDGKMVTIPVTLNIAGPALADGGDSEQWRGTRLTWLDSDLGQSGDTVPPPYTPISYKPTQAEPGESGGYAVTMLDKTITVGEDGLISQVVTGTTATTKPQPNVENNVEVKLLSEPMTLSVSSGGHYVHLNSKPLKIANQSNMSLSWHGSASGQGVGGHVEVDIKGTLDCTGYTDYTLTINPGANRNGTFSVELLLPAEKQNAIMGMGLGVLGGYIDEMPPPTPFSQPEWLVFDFHSVIVADAMGVIASGDNVHDPIHMEIQVATAVTGPWVTKGSYIGTPGTSSRQILKFGDQMTIRSQFWRLIIWDNVRSTMCAPSPFCQTWLGEVQLRDGSTGNWIMNNGTAQHPIVVNASGSNGLMKPWKAADGVMFFNESTNDGWDGAPQSLPGPSPAPSSKDLAIDWHWDGVNGNNAVWSGSSAGGLRLYLKGPEDEWQAAVPFDSRTTPSLPRLWDNQGLGGIQLFKNGSARAYSGDLDLSILPPGPLVFHFSLMATPVRPLDLPKHFRERYAQLGGPTNYTFLAEQGATVVNMHQGNIVNPWINYPYETNTLMKAASEACHKVGLKYKIYNTMRELSNRCREIWAMRALNETYVVSVEGSDVGNGADWLQEHLQRNYEVAWSNPVGNIYTPSMDVSNPPASALWIDHAHEQDAAVKVKALSRWNNYYVAGARQMMEDFDYDGIYLDEIAYDRVTMLRTKKVLGFDKLIDHHSDQKGFTPSPATNYLELYPFIDSLWYGEGFDYDGATPSYWLLEMSGIPHGLNADLLRYSGMTPAHFKGMLVASGNRWQGGFDGPPSQNVFDPRDIWHLWDSFQINQSIMYGWWLDRERGNGTIPVTTSDDNVKVTTYVRKGKAALIVIASFNQQNSTTVTLSINWKQLGLPENTPLVAPELQPMQPQKKTINPKAPISVPPKQGWILLAQID